MSFVSLSQAYRIAPRRSEGARPSAPAPLPAVDARTPPRRGPDADADAERERAADSERDHDCDSARRSPLLRALTQALRTMTAGGASPRLDDVALERALIAFARALNLASHEGDAAPQPAAARADDAARRRARNEERLVEAFGVLLLAAGRPAATPHALQSQLGTFLHQLARQLHIDEDRAGEATQPGSLINIHA